MHFSNDDEQRNADVAARETRGMEALACLRGNREVIRISSVAGDRKSRDLGERHEGADVS